MSRILLVLALLASTPSIASAQAARGAWAPRWRAWSAHGRRLDEETERTPGVARGAIPIAWPESDVPPTAAVNPRRHRRADRSTVIGGTFLLALGWSGAMAIGVLDRADGGARSSCQDTYDALHFVPVVGAWLALVHALDGCRTIDGALLVFDGLATAAQLAGLVMTIVAVEVGELVVALDGPRTLELRLAPLAGASTAGIAIMGVL